MSMKFLFSYIKKHKKLLWFALILGTIDQDFSLASPQLTRILTDEYALKASEYTRPEFLKGIGLILLGYIVVAFVSRLAKNFQDYYVNAISQEVGTELYASSVDHAFKLPFSTFEDERSGSLLQKFQKARNDAQKFIISLITVVFRFFVGMVIVVAYGFIVHVYAGIAYVILIPILGTFAVVITKRIKQAQEKIVKRSVELAGDTTESLRNVELVKSLGLEKQEIKHLNDINDEILGLELEKVKYVKMLSFVQGTLVNFFNVLLQFLLLWLIFTGDITFGEFLTLLFYSFFVFNPLYEAGRIASEYQEADASMDTLKKILELPAEEKPAHPETIDRINTITFKDVTFNYDNNKNALDDISVSIEKGKTTAFVGPSGSGKTTLMKMILGLYKPNKGSVLFNDVPHDTFDFDSYKKRIGYVSQSTQLFAGTIRDNLLFVNPSATDSECVQALSHASVDHVLSRGNAGLDTKIGEGGIKLSGGERQRIAIARALLRNPDILIFDEATSSLDSITEEEITETIKEITKERPDLMTVVVAHRLSTISHADHIYVLEKGELSEDGDHESLLRQDGLYKALWRSQGLEI